MKGSTVHMKFLTTPLYLDISSAICCAWATNTYILFFSTAAVISLHNDTHSFVRVCSLPSPVSHLAGLGATVEHTFSIPIRQAWPKKQLKYLNTWLWLKSALSVRGMFTHFLTRTKSKLALSWYFSKCFYKYQSSGRNTSATFFLYTSWTLWS